MIENGDASEIKRDYLEILESLLKLIQQKAKSKEIKTSDDITINVGREKVYKGVIGEKPSKNTLTPEQVNKISIAISDPKKSQGTISIKIGKQEVFRVQDGQVKTDKLGLAPIEQVPARKTARKSQVKTPDSVETLQKQIQDLQSKVETQQKLIDGIQENQQTPELVSKLAAQVAQLSKSVENQQQLIENIQNSLAKVNEDYTDILIPQLQNTKLQDWLGTSQRNVKQVAKNLFGRIKDVLTFPLRKLGEGIGGLKNNIERKVQGVKSNINKSRGKAFEQDVKALLKIFGKPNPDGSLSFTSSSFDFEQQGESVVVRAKNGDTVLEDGELSPNLSRQQSEALDKVYSVVSRSHKLETEGKQEAQTASKGRRR